MRIITDKYEIRKAKHCLDLAAIEAKNSNCKKSQRGVVIANDKEIISFGHNKPLTPEYCCLRESIKDNTRTELCSAIHAEEMAILNALRDRLIGATMYHIKTKKGEMKISGKPSCPSCSKSISESGIKEFVLWHEEGYYAYKPKELIELSIDYFLKD